MLRTIASALITIALGVAGVWLIAYGFEHGGRDFALAYVGGVLWVLCAIGIVATFMLYLNEIVRRNGG